MGHEGTMECCRDWWHDTRDSLALARLDSVHVMVRGQFCHAAEKTPKTWIIRPRPWMMRHGNAWPMHEAWCMAMSTGNRRGMHKNIKATSALEIRRGKGSLQLKHHRIAKYLSLLSSFAGFLFSPSLKTKKREPINNLLSLSLSQDSSSLLLVLEIFFFLHTFLPSSHLPPTIQRTHVELPPIFGSKEPSR